MVAGSFGHLPGDGTLAEVDARWKFDERRALTFSGSVAATDLRWLEGSGIISDP